MAKSKIAWQVLLRGRRLMSERRRFRYSACIPERRTPTERRTGIERRNLVRRLPDWQPDVALTV
jgi:hypothetical protein